MLVNIRVGKKFQTILPPQIRKSLNLHEGDVLIWEPTKDGEVRVRSISSYSEYLKEIGSQIWTSEAVIKDILLEEDESRD